MDDQCRCRLDFAALALAPFTVLLQGHRFGVGNHDFMLAWMRQMRDSSYLAHDWFLSTDAHHPLLTRLLAVVAGFLGESMALLSVHLVTRVALLMGVWRLALEVLRTVIATHEDEVTSEAASWFGTAAMLSIVLEPRLHVGSHYLQAGAWVPAFAGMAAAVWVLALAMRFADRRATWFSFGIAGGIGIFLHLFIVLPVFGVLILGVLFRRRNLRECYLAGMVALVLGLPSLLPAAVGFFAPGETPLSGSEVITVLQYRHPHHHQPWTWPLHHVVAAVVLLASGAVAWKRLAPKHNRTSLIVPLFLFVYFIISCGLFWIFGRLQIVPLFAYVQAFRILPLFILIALVLLLIVVFGGFDSSHPLVPLCAGLGLLTVARMLPAQAGLFLVALIFLITASRKCHLISLQTRVKLRRGVLAAVMVLSFAGIIVLQTVEPVRRIANRIHHEHWLAAVAPENPARVALAEWIRANTSPEAIFAIPPGMVNFRIWEQRAVVVDLKNVPYKNADLAEWAARTEAATGQPIKPFAVPDLSRMTAERLIRLAREYDATHVVFPGEHPDDLYPGAEYTVIEINSP